MEDFPLVPTKLGIVRSKAIVRVALSFSAGQLICCALVAIAAAADPLTFELSRYDDPIMVPITIGNRPRLCILDSGSTWHVFHTSVLPELGESLADGTGKSPNGGRFTAQFFWPPQSSIGTQDLRLYESVANLDLSRIRGAIGRDIEGVLGMPLFREFVIRTDFDRYKNDFLPSDTEPIDEWGQQVNTFTNDHGLPQIVGRVAGTREVQCIVDTGYSGTISLNSELYSELLGEGAITPVGEHLTAQVNGHRSARKGRLSKLAIGPFQHDNLLILDGGTLNLIGLGYLRRYQVTFDLGRERLFLLKGDNYADRDKERSAVGIGLLRNYGMTEIIFVEDNSAAQKAGLAIHDQLMAVNGTAIHNQPIAEIHSLIRENADANGKIELEIRREDGTRKVPVRIEN
jgi:hypothetical protein